MDIIAKETNGKSYKTYKYTYEGADTLSFAYDDHQEITWERYGENVPPEKSKNMEVYAREICDQKPLFSYFLDGSRHTYKVDDIAYKNKVFPVIAGQVGVSCCKRVEKEMKSYDFDRRLVITLPKVASQSDWNKITIGDYNECLTNAALHCSSTPTPTPEPTPTPNPAPQPPTQPTQELPQQAAQQTAQQQSTQNDTTTAQTEVAKPKSVSPKKVKAAKKAISVEWKKVSGVKGYQVQVATDKKFKKNKKTVTVKKQKTTKTTVKKLKAKKKYYVRVRTYKIVNGKKVYSSWSKIKTVKTK